MEFEKIQSLIASAMNLDPESITPETRFIEDLGADSLDIFQIIMALEDNFHIMIDDSAAEHISTVGDVVEEIKKMS